MASIADLNRLVLLAAEAQARDALQQYGNEWAAATRAEAPVDTGTLRASIRWVPTGPLSGQLEMIGYGRYVNEGHRVARYGTSRRPHRRYKTAGFVAPNPFLLRGAQQSGHVASTTLGGALRNVALRALARVLR